MRTRRHGPRCTRLHGAALWTSANPDAVAGGPGSADGAERHQAQARAGAACWLVRTLSACARGQRGHAAERGGGGAPGGHVDEVAHDELPHHDAEGVDVARLVQPVALAHLGRRVEGRALLDAARVALVVLHAVRQSKVRDLQLKVPPLQRRLRRVAAAKLQAPPGVMLPSCPRLQQCSQGELCARGGGRQARRAHSSAASSTRHHGFAGSACDTGQPGRQHGACTGRERPHLEEDVVGVEVAVADALGMHVVHA